MKTSLETICGLCRIREAIADHFDQLYLYSSSLMHQRRMRYDTIGEFNMDSKAECGQLNPLTPTVAIWVQL